MSSQETYSGLWASINSQDDSTVTYLFYMDLYRYLKRYNGEWVPVDNLDDENTDGDSQVPVTEDFVAVFDKAQEEGVELTVDDAEEYERKIETAQ